MEEDMKKMVLIVFLLSMSLTTFSTAQEGLIGGYLDFGDGLYYPGAGNFNDQIFDVYIIIRVEDIVRGASFKAEILPWSDFQMIHESYPPNIHVGDVLSGLDIGFTDPMYGFDNAPVIVCTMTMLNMVYPNFMYGAMTIGPASANATPIYADGDALLHPLSTSWFELECIANEEATWGRVKTLYR
jgi:hypothetical protein